MQDNYPKRPSKEVYALCLKELRGQVQEFYGVTGKTLPLDDLAVKMAQGFTIYMFEGDMPRIGWTKRKNWLDEK